MKRALCTVLLLAIALAGGGCALFGIETGYRWFTIKNHHFQPAQITVPKGVPFVLVVDAIDDRDPSISAPELGITRLRIPSVAKERRLSGSSVGLSRNAHLPLGPLNAGHYTIFCECHGNPASANILVE
jgi:hypothetical protein